MIEISINQAGARGQASDFQAYVSEKSLSFWALRAQWNLQLVKEMMIQLLKKDALVMEISQFRTVSPPANMV
jgi:hypothetical protein